MKVRNDNEIFKRIDDFPNYLISNLGNVYSLRKKSFLRPCDDGHGYLMLHLCKDNRQYVKKVHRLVAEAFIENPNCLTDVNHKDENKKNNNVNNLEWCTRKYNINYGSRTQRQIKTVSKPIKMLDKNTNEIIAIFNSSYDASNKTGINEPNINSVCNHKRKTAGGYKWEFLSEV